MLYFCPVSKKRTYGFAGDFAVAGYGLLAIACSTPGEEVGEHKMSREEID